MSGCRRRPPCARAGTSLLEVLCVLAILTMLGSVLSQTFIATTRLSAVSNRALDRTRHTAELGDVFRDAVRGAGRVAEGVLDYKTGEGCLVLELPPAPETNARRYAVLRRTEAGTLTRMDLEQRGDGFQSDYLKTYALKTAAIRFFTEGNGRMVSMEITLQNPSQSPNRPPLLYRYTETMRSILNGEGAA